MPYRGIVLREKHIECISLKKKGKHLSLENLNELYNRITETRGPPSQLDSEKDSGLQLQCLLPLFTIYSVYIYII